MVNTLGISITLLPFLVLYAKEITGAGNEQVATFLILKVSGSVFIGLLLFLMAGRVRYQPMLYTIGTLSLLMPLSLYLLPFDQVVYFLFIPGGIIFALEQIVIRGILLEITSNQNRAFFAGLAGVGNLLPALFPILGGWMIQFAGFPTFFALFGIVIFISFYFMHQLDCHR